MEMDNLLKIFLYVLGSAFAFACIAEVYRDYKEMQKRLAKKDKEKEKEKEREREEEKGREKGDKFRDYR